MYKALLVLWFVVFAGSSWLIASGMGLTPDHYVLNVFVIFAANVFFAWIFDREDTEESHISYFITIVCAGALVGASLLIFEVMEFDQILFLIINSLFGASAYYWFKFLNEYYAALHEFHGNIPEDTNHNYY